MEAKCVHKEGSEMKEKKKLTKEERERLADELFALGEDELALMIESEREIVDPAEIAKAQAQWQEFVSRVLGIPEKEA